jgi:TonB family protein
MYFDFDDRYSDVEPVGRAMTPRDGVLLSVAVHAVMLLALIFGPSWLPVSADSEAEVVKLERPEEEEAPRFVFVQPKLDVPALEPPKRAELSDIDRKSAQPEVPPVVDNPLPFSRGNSPERVEARREEIARGRGPAEEPAPPSPPAVESPPAESSEGRMAMQKAPPEPQSPPPGGKLGDALRNLQKYVDQESFNNQRGSTQEFGPLQFDTKGVEFGPWVRRFVAQVRRNWFVPYAAMSLRGRVIITFFVHRNGSLTDVTIVSPSPVESFNLSARNALLASNPTEPLPPEYPEDKAFFTVTFYYNESPDGRTQQ